MDIELPGNFAQFTTEEQTLILEYLNQLNDMQKQVYNIAKQHLGSSFHILKSNGFIEWNKRKSISQ
jgi:hypothetical protein